MSQKLEDHKAPIIAISSYKRKIVSGGDKGELIAWLEQDGMWRQQQKLEKHNKGYVMCIAFSSHLEDNLMASGDRNGLIIIWQ